MNKDFLNKFKNFLCENFILTHVAICLIGFVFILNTQVFINVDIRLINFYPPFLLNYFPDKKAELIAYMITIAYIFIAFLFFITLYLNREKIEKHFKNIRSEKFLLFILFFDVVANIILSLKMGRYLNYSLIITTLWLIIFLYPISFLSDKIYAVIDSNYFKLFKKTLLSLFFIFSIFNLIYLFKPFAIDKLYLHHEIFNIPQSTKLGNKLVDNAEYIKKDNSFGFRKIYDIRRPDESLAGVNCTAVSNIKIKDELNSIIDKENLDKKFSEKKSKLRTYFYSEGNKICSISKLTISEIKFLENNIYPIFNNDFEKIVLNNYQIPKAVDDGSEESEFLEANFNGFTWEYIAAWRNHQNHILSPISKTNLGIAPSQIFAQYGYGTTMILKTILDHMNGFNFGDYYKVINSFLYIYYFAFATLLFVIFKNKSIALGALGLTLIALDNFLYFHWYIAPGANPIRHFFDIFVIYFMYIYIKKPSLIKMCVIDLCCLLGVFIYPIYGLFLSIATTTTFFLRQIAKKSKSEIVNAVILTISALICYKLFSIGMDLSSKNFFSGLSGFLATKKILFLIYILIISSYILIIKNIKKTNTTKDLLLLLTLYIQGILLYYITISEISHFLVLAPIYIIALFLFIQLYQETLNISEKKSEVINFIFCLLIFTGLIIKAFPGHVKDVHLNTKNIKYHPIYHWTIPNSNFDSDMNPIYFEDSIKLLQKYSQGNKIYMISEYDNFLPLLANKYNAFPYIDLQWYLTENEDYNVVKDQLLTDKPKYILVDKILTTDKLESVVNERFYTLSLMKYYNLKTLQKLFNEVSSNYKPIASSYLLTVYERKNAK